MLSETGRVVAVEADGLWVETIRRSSCGSCSARRGCGHGLLNRLGDGRNNLVRVLPGGLATEDFAVDDEVLIALPESVISPALTSMPPATFRISSTGAGV